MDVIRFILSPFKSKNSAPIEEDLSADDQEVNNEKAATSVAPKGRKTQKRKADVKPKSTRVEKKNVKAKKSDSIKSVVAKKKPSRATISSGKAKRKQQVKVKLEPARRSRRSKAYKKGSLSEKVLLAKAWKGSGSRDDPLVLVRH